MRVTVDQAKQHWCPFSRVDDGTNDFAYNRVGNNVHPHGAGVGMCLGEQCMAWRWSHELNPFKITRNNYEKNYKSDERFEFVQDDPDEEHVVWVQIKRTHAVGFCGLAEPRVSQVQVP